MTLSILVVIVFVMEYRPTAAISHHNSSNKSATTATSTFAEVNDKSRADAAARLKKERRNERDRQRSSFKRVRLLMCLHTADLACRTSAHGALFASFALCV